MEFIPRYFARKFRFFESVSMLKFFLLFFGAFIITTFVSLQLGEFANNILMSLVSSLMPICFAGFVSTRHFSKKVWVPTSPLIVQFSSQPWFNAILSVLSTLRHWVVLLFVNVTVVMVLLIIATPIIKLIGSSQTG